MPILRSTLAARRKQREQVAYTNRSTGKTLTSTQEFGPLGGLHGPKDLERTLKRDADEVHRTIINTFDIVGEIHVRKVYGGS